VTDDSGVIQGTLFIVGVTKYLCEQRAMLTEESESEAGEIVLLMPGN
jgi:hypothetical protein